MSPAAMQGELVPVHCMGRRQHLQGSTWGYLFLETFAGSSASTFGCSFPTSFSSCRTGKKRSPNVSLESSCSRLTALSGG